MLEVGGYTTGVLGGNLAVRMSGGTNDLGPFLKGRQDLSRSAVMCQATRAGGV